MRAEIIRGGELNRERWFFELSTNIGGRVPDLYFNSYVEESRLTKRHMFRTVNHWKRHERRLYMTLDKAPLPADVVQEAKDRFCAEIQKLEVTA
jgi:hypothetical protein